MKCKIKAQTFTHALNSVGVLNQKEIQNSIASGEEVDSMLSDYSSLVGEEDFEALAEEQSRLKVAFKGVRRFKEFGLIMPTISNAITNVTDRFLSSMVTTSREAVDFVSQAIAEGTLSVSGSTINSSVSVDVLNDMVRERLVFSELNSNTKYFIEKNGEIIVTRNLLNAINNNKYEMYLSEMANFATRTSKATEEEYTEANKEMHAGPVVSNLKHRRAGLYKRLRILKNSSTIDQGKISEVDVAIKKLTNDISNLEAKVTPRVIMDTFLDAMNSMTAELKVQSTLTTESMAAYMDTLEMIISASSYGKDNRIFDTKEQENTLIMNEMAVISAKARKLKEMVDDAAMVRLGKTVSDEFNMDIDDEKMFTVFGLGNWQSRMFQKVLGIQHINNPIVQFIQKITEKSIFDANFRARKINNVIEDLYKEAIVTKEDSELLYQKSKNGLKTGFMVDVFTSEFWKKGKAFKQAKYRKMHAIELDPVLLFDRAIDDSDNVRLRAEIETLLGPYMAKKYIDVAQKKYEQYKSAEASARITLSETEYEDWIDKNSPIKRLEAIENEDNKTVATDSYLSFIPKGNDKSVKRDFYDESYHQVMDGGPMEDMYKYVREQFIQNQQTLNRFSRELKPPELGFLNKTTLELLQEGDTMRALQNQKDKLTMKYGKQNLEGSAQPINPATGKRQPQLEEELHSMGDEISRRYKKLTLDNATEIAVLNKKQGKQARLDYKNFLDNLYTQAQQEVDNEMSGDFLQSITMSNYSAQTLIEKSKVEAEIKITMNLLRSGHIEVDKESKKSAFDSAHTMLFDSVTNYVDRRFYGIQNHEQDLILNTDKQKELDNGKELKDSEAMTTRPVSSGLIYATRLIALGWSTSTALYNFGQAFISNINKGMQGDYYSVGDFLSSYKDILQPKNQKIIDMLYIMGDVAHQYEKRTIHDTNKWSKRMGSMYVQTKVETVNQGSVAIAVMKGITVTNSKTGAELSLYEAIDENGELSDDFVGKVRDTAAEKSGMDLMSDVVLTKIRPANAQASGDYISPLLLETTEGGRLLMVFKKWLAEPLLDRFGSERISYMEQRQVRGSLRTIGTQIRKLSRGETMNDVELKRAMDGYKEVILVIGTKLMALLVGKLLCDTKECKEKHGATLFAINYVDKITDDATGVLAGGVGSMLSSPFASVSILENTAVGLYETAKWATGAESAVYKTDTEFTKKGDAKAPERFKKLLPFVGGNYYRPRLMWTKRRNGYFSELGTGSKTPARASRAEDIGL